MQRLTLEPTDFQSLEDPQGELAAELDRQVLRTPEIDHYCASTLWSVPAHLGLMSGHRGLLFAGEPGYVALAQGQHEEGWWYAQPLEAAWMLACPFVGPEPERLVRGFRELYMAMGEPWHVVMVGGVVYQGRLFRSIVQQFGQWQRILLGPQTRRHVADLSAGSEGFLARRSRNFRKGLRRAERQAQRLGLEFERIEPRAVADPYTLYHRVQAVEARSWKGVSGQGINQGDMQRFYAVMIPYLWARGALRLIFARHEGVDVGYILGGVFADTYRGLQFSFDDAFRDVGLGNLLQIRQIGALADEPGVVRYDLGTENPYKHRWAEAVLDTVTVILARW